MSSQADDTDSLQPRILDYLRSRLPHATALALHDVQRIVVGWSHETWLFDLHYHGGRHSRKAIGRSVETARRSAC